MKKKFLFILIIISVLILTGAGCISFKKGGNDLGVFKTNDKGDTWQHKVGVLHVGTANPTIAGVNIRDFVIDPSDSKTIYALSEGQGLFYTYDSGESWSLVKNFSNKTINSVAVDYKNKCTIYTAIDNKIYKSEDCSRNWKLVYDDPRADNIINTLDIDSFNSQIIYAGSAKGDVLKSLDAGRSWKIINRFKSSVEKILVAHQIDTRNIYVATFKNGVYKTPDAGGTWEESYEILRAYSGGLEYRDMVYHKNELILATKYGLFKTSNNNEWQDWQPIELITAPGSTLIYSLAVNPQNSNEIYYGTDKTFYRTNDSGKTWTTKSLPSTGAATSLLIDFNNPQTIYLGITKLKK